MRGSSSPLLLIVLTLAILADACTELTSPPPGATPVEVWGAAVSGYARSAPVLQPVEQVRAPDGGLAFVMPEGLQPSSSPEWVKHQVTISIWAKGDQDAAQRMLERWAAEGLKATTSGAR